MSENVIVYIGLRDIAAAIATAGLAVSVIYFVFRMISPSDDGEESW